MANLSQNQNLSNLKIIKDTGYLIRDDANIMIAMLQDYICYKHDGAFILIGERGALIGFYDGANGVGYAKQYSYYNRYEFTLLGGTATKI